MTQFFCYNFLQRHKIERKAFQRFLHYWKIDNSFKGVFLMAIGTLLIEKSRQNDGKLTWGDLDRIIQ